MLNRKGKSCTYFNYKVKLLKMKTYEKNVSNARKNSYFKIHALHYKETYISLGSMRKHLSVCIYGRWPTARPWPVRLQAYSVLPRIKTENISDRLERTGPCPVRDICVALHADSQERASHERCTDLWLWQIRRKRKTDRAGLCLSAYVKPKSPFLRL